MPEQSAETLHRIRKLRDGSFDGFLRWPVAGRPQRTSAGSTRRLMASSPEVRKEARSHSLGQEAM
jgi:hypothetical protein